MTDSFVDRNPVFFGNRVVFFFSVEPQGIDSHKYLEPVEKTNALGHIVSRISLGSQPSLDFYKAPT